MQWISLDEELTKVHTESVSVCVISDIECL